MKKKRGVYPRERWKDGKIQHIGDRLNITRKRKRGVIVTKKQISEGKKKGGDGMNFRRVRQDFETENLRYDSQTWLSNIDYHIHIISGLLFIFLSVFVGYFIFFFLRLRELVDLGLFQMADHAPFKFKKKIQNQKVADLSSSSLASSSFLLTKMSHVILQNNNN